MAQSVYGNIRNCSIKIIKWRQDYRPRRHLIMDITWIYRVKKSVKVGRNGKCELHTMTEAVQVNTLLHVIREQCREILVLESENMNTIIDGLFKIFNILIL